MMIRNAVLAAALLAAPLAAAPASAAPSTITFDGLAGSTTPFSPDGVVTFSSSADPNAYYVGDVGDSADGTNLFTLLQGEALLPTAGTPATLIISFAHPITFASFDLGLVDLTQFFGGSSSGDTASYSTNGGESGTVTALLGSGALYPDVAVSISGAAFSTITLTSADTMAIDNVYPAPEPASLALLATGLVGFAAARRRRA